MRIIQTYTIILISMLLIVNNASAQELEPRAYSNAPVGLNFVVLGYQYSKGGLLFDPAIAIIDAHSEVNVGVFGYLRTLEVPGMSEKEGIVSAYADL